MKTALAVFIFFLYSATFAFAHDLPIDEVPVSDEERACTRNRDCTSVMDNCHHCGCVVPISRASEKAYGRRFREVCGDEEDMYQEYQGKKYFNHSCMSYCPPQDAACVQGKCVLIPQAGETERSGSAHP